MQKDEEIVFRTPEIPKLRRRKSLPNTSSASKEDRKSQISLVSTVVMIFCLRFKTEWLMNGFQTSSSSFSESLNSSETSFGDLSLNSSYEDYAEIETLTNSFDKLTNQFDDDKSAKVTFDCRFRWTQD